MSESSPVPLDLVIVIVNYNTAALLRDCLCSVFASRGVPSLVVCVVDNASKDDSVALVRAGFPQVHVIANPTNMGYPQANNQGLRYFGFSDLSPSPSHLSPNLSPARGGEQTPPSPAKGGEPAPSSSARGGKPAPSSSAKGGEPAPSSSARGGEQIPPSPPKGGEPAPPFPIREGGPGGLGLPRYALLLNPDTVLRPDTLAEMIAFMEAHPQAGVAGPKLVRLDGSLDTACRRSFPTPESSFWHLMKLDRLFSRSRRFGRYGLTYLDPDEVTQVDAVVGAFMLVRREAIVQAGLLDETFFMYGEDLDWAKRITDAGWQVWYNPQVVVTHVKEAASRHSYRARVEFYRALIVFYEKHYRMTTPFWLDWLIRGGVAFFGGLDLLGRRLRGLRVGT